MPLVLTDPACAQATWPHDVRLTLSRVLDSCEPAPAVVFIMLNPSTADDARDDPTVRRCIGFARRERASRLFVVNLFIWRSPSPRTLWRALSLGETPAMGAQALDAIDRTLRSAGGKDRIICAWGGAGSVPAAVRSQRQQRIDTVLELARLHRRPLHCLGRTADDSPRHPLYVRRDQPLEPFVPSQ